MCITAIAMHFETNTTSTKKCVAFCEMIPALSKAECITVHFTCNHSTTENLLHKNCFLLFLIMFVGMLCEVISVLAKFIHSQPIKLIIS